MIKRENEQKEKKKKKKINKEIAVYSKNNEIDSLVDRISSLVNSYKRQEPSYDDSHNTLCKKLLVEVIANNVYSGELARHRNAITRSTGPPLHLYLPFSISFSSFRPSFLFRPSRKLYSYKYLLRCSDSKKRLNVRTYPILPAQFSLQNATRTSLLLACNPFRIIKRRYFYVSTHLSTRSRKHLTFITRCNSRISRE